MSFDRLIRAAELFSTKASEVCSSDVEMKGKDYHIHGVEFVLRTVLSPSYKGSRSYDDRMSSLRDKLEFHCEALCVRRKGDPENTRPSEASLLLAQQILLVLRGQEHDAMAMQLAATRRFGQGRRDGKRRYQQRKLQKALVEVPTSDQSARCYVIGRIRLSIIDGRKAGLFLATAFASRADATNQPMRNLTGEQYINVFQTDIYPSYKLAVAVAQATYKEKFPLLHDEFSLGDFE